MGADAAEAGSLESVYPSDYARSSAQHSGKMRCLEVLLSNILSQEDPDKVVIVSNSTAALDIIQTVCDQQRYTTVRIDGATDVNKRQDIVNSFNLYGSAQVMLCKHIHHICVTFTLHACFNPSHDKYSQMCLRHSASECPNPLLSMHMHGRLANRLLADNTRLHALQTPPQRLNVAHVYIDTTLLKKQSSFGA